MTIPKPMSPAEWTRDQCVPELVETLAYVRTQLADTEELLAGMERAFFASTEVERLTTEAARLKAEATVFEYEIKRVAVAVYGVTGERKPAPGVEVKLYDELVYSRDAADAWTKEKGLFRVPECLDEKAFEKFAKSSPDVVPFVDVERKPRATIAKVLP